MSSNETLEQALSEVEMMKKIRTQERLKESRELKIQKEIELEMFKQQLKEELQEDEEGSQLEEVRVKVDEELTKLRRKDRDKQRMRKYRKLQKMKSEEEKDKQRKYRNLQKIKSEEEKIAEKRENQRIRSRKFRERKKCEDPEKFAEMQARVYFSFYLYGLEILKFS